MTGERTLKTRLTRYHMSTVAFLVSLGLSLFTVVEIRRGFLFSDYLKVGSPSSLLNLDLRHLPLLLVGVLGLWVSYRYMAKLEKGLKERGIDLKTQTRVVAVVIGVFLVIDLFIYRGVPATRFVTAGTMGVGQSIPIDSFPAWLRPVGGGIDYLLLVWHATVLGMLLGSLFLVAGAGIIARLRGGGFGAHLAGVATAIPQPFCSCCAAPVGSALYRKGASLGPVLAFMVSSPMLNITGLILAAALLPTSYAVLRIVGGIIVGVFLTYAVAHIAARWVMTAEPGPNGKLFVWSSRVLSAYSRLFHFERLLREEALDSPVALIANWLSMAWQLTKVVIPVLLVGSVLAVYIVQAIPDSGNNIAGVAITAIFATLLMVPTWTEIPVAAGFINDGLTGMAATVLIALPAVSMPSLVIAAGAVRSLKVAITLGLSVLMAGILAGIVFL